MLSPLRLKIGVVVSDFFGHDRSLVPEITRLGEKVTLDSPDTSLPGGLVRPEERNANTEKNTYTLNKYKYRYNADANANTYANTNTVEI